MDASFVPTQFGVTGERSTRSRDRPVIGASGCASVVSPHKMRLIYTGTGFTGLLAYFFPRSRPTQGRGAAVARPLHRSGVCTNIAPRPRALTTPHTYYYDIPLSLFCTHYSNLFIHTPRQPVAKYYKHSCSLT